MLFKNLRLLTQRKRKKSDVFMTIGERIKTIRGNLSRDKFAPIMCISKTTLVNYETGLRTPDADFLNKILAEFPDVNPTWLLTGEGQRERGKACGWWAEKIKEIRGDLSIPEFVKKVGFTDPDAWVVTIQAIEDKKIDADLSLITVLLNELDISVDWMFGVHGVPKTINGRATGTINIDLLKEITKEAELYESINPGSLSPDKKAELMAELYAMRAAKER
jgi:transcriptional regulator with XRE-family HTH domain